MLAGKTNRAGRARGAALILAIVFLAIFGALVMPLIATASSNVVVAHNRSQACQASAIAETGLQLCLYHMGGMAVPSSGGTEYLHGTIALHLVDAWWGSGMIQGADPSWNSEGIGLAGMAAPCRPNCPGTLDIRICADGPPASLPNVLIESTGRFGRAVRTARYTMKVTTGLAWLGDYGIASKSAIEMRGNPTIQGVNSSHEGSVLSCTEVTLDAINLWGSVEVSGDVAVTNEEANINTRGRVTIGGDEIYGAAEPDWPEVDTAMFEPYATNVLTEVPSSDAVLSNVRIPAGMNPTFNAGMTLNGVIYIESPNDVRFSGHAQVCGIIVMEEKAEGAPADSITFTGTVDSYGVEQLPDEPQYADIRNMTGSFLLAPDAQATFTGNFNTINGCLVASGFEFSGNAGGTVRGAIVNLADSYFTIDGNVTLNFDRENDDDTPAGLRSSCRLVGIQGSYEE
jgi:hypothetical protein